MASINVGELYSPNKGKKKKSDKPNSGESKDSKSTAIKLREMRLNQDSAL